jgi:hypothetical protein
MLSSVQIGAGDGSCAPEFPDRGLTPGTEPADGLTGYRQLDPVDNGIERWGDYSDTVSDSAGTDRQAAPAPRTRTGSRSASAR